MTQFENVLETILEEYARRDSEGEFDTWEETDAFVKEKAEVLLAYAKEKPVNKELEEAARPDDTRPACGIRHPRGHETSDTGGHPRRLGKAGGDHDNCTGGNFEDQKALYHNYFVCG